MKEEAELVPPGSPPPHPDAGPRALPAAPTAPLVSAFRLTQEPVTSVEEATAPARPGPAVPAYEYLGELPATYSTQTVYLVAYDPRRLFVYWDIDWSLLPGEGPVALQIYRAEDGLLEHRLEIDRTESSRYVPVGRAGDGYYVELGLGGGGFERPWRRLATSDRVTTPPEGLAGEDPEAQFATLPFHLSFQRLVDVLRAAMNDGESLTTALARLQRGLVASGRTGGGSSLLDVLGGLTAAQRTQLAFLLGWEMVTGRDGGPAGTSGGDRAAGVFPAGQRGGGPAGDQSGTVILDSAAFAAARAGASGAGTLAGGAFASENLSSAALAAGGAAAGISSAALAAGGAAAGISSAALAGAAAAWTAVGLSSESFSSTAWAALAAAAVAPGAQSSGELATAFAVAVAAAAAVAASAQGSEALSSALLGLAGAAPASGAWGHSETAGISSQEAWRQLVAAAGAGGSEVLSSAAGAGQASTAGLSSEASVARWAAAAAGASGGSFGGAGGGSESSFRPGPSSEAWRLAASGAGAVSSSDHFAREKAERFLRAITSSLDVLSGLFSAAHAGASGGSFFGSGSGPGNSSSGPADPGRGG